MRYRLTLTEKLRYRYGLRWIGALPNWQDYAKDIAAIGAIALLYGIAGSLDYAAEKAAEAERYAASAANSTAELAASLNGTLTLQHAGPHADGHAITAVRCRGAEEYRL